MNEMMAPDRICQMIVKTLSEALMVPPERVVPAARIVSDLHAESIDVADIRFRIEESLGIRIDQREMTEAIGTGVSAEEFDSHFTVQFVVDYVTQRMKS